MLLEIYTERSMIEEKCQLAARLFKLAHRFRSRFVLDPLAESIFSSTPRIHKLEVLVLALTLLRYNDCTKLNIDRFLNGSSQEIRQGKTKEIVEVPPLFLSTSPLMDTKFPAVSLFTDSYDKLRYTLKKSIPQEIRSHLDTQRSLTHIFRFLRSTFYYLTDKDYFKASKYLGHKDPESIKSYVPPDLANYYYQYLKKG